MCKYQEQGDIPILLWMGDNFPWPFPSVFCCADDSSWITFSTQGANGWGVELLVWRRVWNKLRITTSFTELSWSWPYGGRLLWALLPQASHVRLSDRTFSVHCTYFKSYWKHRLKFFESERHYLTLSEMCFWAKQFASTMPCSTQEYDWVVMGGKQESTIKLMKYQKIFLDSRAEKKF